MSKKYWAKPAKWNEYSATLTNLRICETEFTIYHKKDGTFVLDCTGGYEESRLGQFTTLDAAKREAYIHIKAMIEDMSLFLKSVDFSQE
jgi:hypothetical protein